MNKPCSLCPYEECRRSCFKNRCINCNEFPICDKLKELYSYYFVEESNQLTLLPFISRKQFREIRDKIIKCQNRRKWLEINTDYSLFGNRRK